MNRDDRIIGVANLAQYRNIVMYTPVSTSEGGPPKSMYHHIDRSAEVCFFSGFRLLVRVRVHAALATRADLDVDEADV